MATTLPALKTVPPGPQGGFLGLKTLRAFQKDILAFTGNAASYGDVAAFKLGPVDAYLLSNPADVYRILVEDVDKFPRPDTIKRVLGRMVGKSILLTDGAFWLRQRRLVQPAFHHKRIESYAELMVAQTEHLLAKWQDGEQRDFSADMQRLALDIVAETLFNSQDDRFADQIHAVAVRLQAGVARRLRQPIDLDWPPTVDNRHHRRDLAVLDRLMRSIIEERRKSNVDQGDLLSMLMASQDVDGSLMSDQQVRDEAITLFLAGHDTTALALAWTFYLLAQNPDIATKLNEEVDRVLAGRAPTMADLPGLTYTDQIVKEVLRLYPSAYFASRQAAVDTEIGGYKIRKGAQVFYLPYLIHRDKRFFAEPERFMPERWADGFEKSLPKCAYVPFSAGPHICIGNQFALMEARLILATVAQEWKLELVPGQAIRPVPYITLYPNAPIQMRVSRRA